MPAKEPLKPFREATLRELIEESRRLVKQAEETRKRLADVATAIGERTRDGVADDAPPTQSG